MPPTYNRIEHSVPPAPGDAERRYARGTTSPHAGGDAERRYARGAASRRAASPYAGGAASPYAGGAAAARASGRNSASRDGPTSASPASASPVGRGSATPPGQLRYRNLDLDLDLVTDDDVTDAGDLNFDLEPAGPVGAGAVLNGGAGEVADEWELIVANNKKLRDRQRTASTETVKLSIIGRSSPEAIRRRRARCRT